MVISGPNTCPKVGPLRISNYILVYFILFEKNPLTEKQILRLIGSMADTSQKPKDRFPPPDSYHRIPVDLFYAVADKRLSPMEFFVYCLLRAHAMKSDECYPGVDALAREAGVTAITIKRSLKQLEAENFIQRYQGEHPTKTTRLLVTVDDDGVCYVPRKRLPKKKIPQLKSSILRNYDVMARLIEQYEQEAESLN